MGNLSSKKQSPFNQLPFEIGKDDLIFSALKIMASLDEQDLLSCRLVCSTWNFLANHNILWYNLSKQIIPNLSKSFDGNFNWWSSFWLLHKNILLFNQESENSINKLIGLNAIENDEKSIAEFLKSCPLLQNGPKSYYLSHPSRAKILVEYIKLFSYEGISLPEAFRLFTVQFDLMTCHSHSWQHSLETFASHYYQTCKPNELTEDMVFPLCYSMLLLDIDLKFAFIKNKMSKREFIRNCRGIESISNLSAEYFGNIYDFMLLRGLKTLPIEDCLPLKCVALLSSVEKGKKVSTKLIKIK